MVGGVADYTQLLAQRLTRLDVDVDVLTSFDSDGGEFVPDDPYGVNVYRRVHRWNFGVLRHLREVIALKRPDILHLQFQTGAFGMHPAVMLAPGWLRARRSPVRWVTTFHDLRAPYLFPKAHPVRHWVMRRLQSDSDAVVATNGVDAAVLGAVRGTEGVRVIPIGSAVPAMGDPMSRADIATRWGVPATAGLLGFFGMLNHGKGVDTLVRALRLLVDAGRDVRLLMVGDPVGASDPTNRAYREQVQALAADLGVAGRVAWTGHLPTNEVTDVLKALDACVLPFVGGASYRQSTLLAALTSGAALVSTTPAPAEAAEPSLPPLVDGEHCLLTPPGDPAALTAACARLLDDAALRQRLRRGAATLGERFDWDRIAAGHVALYESLLRPQERA